MGRWSAGFVCIACVLSRPRDAFADDSHRVAPAAHPPKPWCAPEVSELSDHVCFFDGGLPDDGRRTLVIYLHGFIAAAPGFQWLQQRGMAIHAKRLGFTVMLPTSPAVEGGYVWPTSRAAEEKQEPEILAIRKRRPPRARSPPRSPASGGRIAPRSATSGTWWTGAS